MYFVALDLDGYYAKSVPVVLGLAIRKPFYSSCLKNGCSKRTDMSRISRLNI